MIKIPNIKCEPCLSLPIKKKTTTTTKQTNLHYFYHQQQDNIKLYNLSQTHVKKKSQVFMHSHIKNQPVL